MRIDVPSDLVAIRQALFIGSLRGGGKGEIILAYAAISDKVIDTHGAGRFETLRAW
jgi:hypothetical protein